MLTHTSESKIPLCSTCKFPVLYSANIPPIPRDLNSILTLQRLFINSLLLEKKNPKHRCTLNHNMKNTHKAPRLGSVQLYTSPHARIYQYVTDTM